jgi:hypothetical protein
MRQDLLEDAFQLLRRVVGIARPYQALLNQLYPGLYKQALELVVRLDETRRDRILAKSGMGRLCPKCRKRTDFKTGVCLVCQVGKESRRA